MAITLEFNIADILSAGIPDALVNAVAAGQACRVGATGIYPDVDLQMIWLSDPYGLDSCGSSTFTIGDIDSARKAVARALEVDMGDNPHDRRYCPQDYDSAIQAQIHH